MNDKLEQYDMVKVVSIREDRFVGKPVHFERNPVLGDVGAIVECYDGAFEVECSDPHGITIWLEAMFPDELLKV